jgi:plasmid segregation protein ParM
MKLNKPVIALDIGRSSVKAIGFDGNLSKNVLIPSFACRAIEITDEVEAAKAANETVQLNGTPWFFGDTAMVQGRNLSDGLHDDWIFTDEHTALLLGALKRLNSLGIAGVAQAIIILGLPGRLHKDQAGKLHDHVKQYLPNATIKVQPQPAGPYYQMMFNEDGTENGEHNMMTESWGIVEIGHYTTDFSLFLEGGRPIQDGLDSCNGVKVAIQELQRMVQKQHRIQIDFNEATVALQKGYIRNFGQTINLEKEIGAAGEVLAKQIISYADRIMADHARKLTGVILAGGAAQLLQSHFKKHWPTTYLPYEPRYSVAIGFLRFGIGFARFMAQKEEKQKVA